MNHLYFEEEKVRRFTQALVHAKPFTGGDFLLCRDVPLKCLHTEAVCFRSTRNLDTMDEHTALQSVDFLICRDRHAVLGLTFDFDPRDSKHIFGTVLRGLAHIAVPACDFQQEDYDTEGLLQHILELLETLPDSEYELSVHCVQGSFCVPELQRIGMVSPYGNATMYGRDCGLVFFCHPNGDDGMLEIPAVAGQGWDTYQKAIRFVPSANCEQLRQFLQSPADKFFMYHSKELQDLQQLAHQQSLRTVADCLKLLKALSEPEQAALARRCIMQPLCFVGMHIHFPILGQSLEQFCRETACLAENYYPLWLYEKQLRPYMNGHWGCDLSLPAVLRFAASCDVRNLECALMELLLQCCQEAETQRAAQIRFS